MFGAPALNSDLRMTLDEMKLYPPRFAENEKLRSEFIREITLQQIEASTANGDGLNTESSRIPRRLVRYWHDLSNLPQDVQACLRSWDKLGDNGFELRMFDDASAATYITRTYGEREGQAFLRCSHPAMRSDYLRLCFVLAEGGLYVDADDVLIGEGWVDIFRDGKLKVQPFCYDIEAGGMLSAADIWRSDLACDGRVFYVNNDPIAAPPDHPVLQRALGQATEKLLAGDPSPDIQSTTGPGNLTEALAVHAHQLQLAGLPFDFALLRDWDRISEMRWDLSYRGDSRNWRNVYGC